MVVFGKGWIVFKSRRSLFWNHTDFVFDVLCIWNRIYIDVTSIYLKEQKFLAESLMGISYTAILRTYIHSYTNQRETKHRHEIWNFYFAHFFLTFPSFLIHIFLLKMKINNMVRLWIINLSSNSINDMKFILENAIYTIVI